MRMAPQLSSPCKLFTPGSLLISFTETAVNISASLCYSIGGSPWDKQEVFPRVCDTYFQHGKAWETSLFKRNQGDFLWHGQGQHGGICRNTYNRTNSFMYKLFSSKVFFEKLVLWSIGNYTIFASFFLFFWPHTWHAKVHRPRITLVPQQWQCWFIFFSFLFFCLFVVLGLHPLRLGVKSELLLSA